MSASTPPSDLQFDRAEFSDSDDAIPACGLCQQPIASTYFEINGQTTCPACQETIATAHHQAPVALGVLKALGAGLVAGVGGALLYYLVVVITGYEIGLVAVVVGFMVGRSVHWASGGRGGARYQAIAVAITYVAIVSTYVPFIFAGLDDPEAQQEEAVVEAEAAASAPDAPMSVSAEGALASEEPLTRADLAIGLAILAGVILASPFLIGFQNIIGWVIIGFALFEAWRVNRRVEITIAGPFELAGHGVRPSAVPET